MRVPEILHIALDWYEDDHDPADDDAWTETAADVAEARAWLKRIAQFNNGESDADDLRWLRSFD